MKWKRNCVSLCECLLWSRSSSIATPPLLHPSWIFSEPKSWTCGENPSLRRRLLGGWWETTEHVDNIDHLNKELPKKTKTYRAFWCQYLFLTIGFKVLELYINTIQINYSHIFMKALYVSRSFLPLKRSADNCWRRLILVLCFLNSHDASCCLLAEGWPSAFCVMKQSSTG